MQTSAARLIPFFLAGLILVDSGSAVAKRCEGGKNSSLLIPDDYDPLYRPEEGTEVNFDCWIRGVKEVDEKRSQVSLATVVTAEWNEPRIGTCIGPVPAKMLDEIWKPNIIFAFGDKVDMIPNTGEQEARGDLGRNETRLIWMFDVNLASQGTKRAKGPAINFLPAFQVIDCKMHFGWYPLDSHKCLVRVFELNTDISYSTREINSTIINLRKELQFAIHYDWLKEEEKAVLRYPAAGFAVFLKRRVYPVALNVICPTLIVTLISTISFKIPPDSVPGRMGLLVTCLLVIVNITGTRHSSDGGISNAFTLLDIWIISCQLVVSFGLVEYTLILKMVRDRKLLRSSANMTSVGNIAKTASEIDVDQACSRMDRKCFRGLLTTYLAFACSYWAIAMTAANV